MGENDYHGGDGPVSVTTSKPGVNPLFEAMIEAGVQAGYPRTDDSTVISRKVLVRSIAPSRRRAVAPAPRVAISIRPNRVLT